MADQGVVLAAPGEAALEEIHVDEPAPGEVRLRIDATGVCHSDLHAIQEDGWGHTLPVLLGHEGAGTVERVGEGVKGLAEGDRVVIGWHTACGACAACARGLPRQCKRPPVALERLHRADGATLTAFLRTGTFATRTVVPAVAAVRIPDALPSEQACLLGCAVATGVMSVLETARVWEGARVAVIGCGAVGLSAIQGARIAGASEIRAIDIDDGKREQALLFGATHTEPGPVDFVFDVVSRASTFEQALGMIASGGTVVVVGLAPAGETATVDLPALFGRRARVLVSHGGDHLPHEDFPRLAQWALDGRLDLASMVTRTGGLADWSGAFDAMQDGRVIRTVLRP
ncbi:MAG TPA: alcohol dehydrogenase catalytic domain-containing protein [Gaiellaceae bacterium]|nr:alcohol dehydrogenase catalytic domain-containing protein [Gaiellaceae bacterium]